MQLPWYNSAMPLIKNEDYYRKKIGDEIKQAMISYAQEGMPMSKLVLMEEAEQIARGDNDRNLDRSFNKMGRDSSWVQGKRSLLDHCLQIRQ